MNPIQKLANEHLQHVDLFTGAVAISKIKSAMEQALQKGLFGTFEDVSIVVTSLVVLDEAAKRYDQTNNNAGRLQESAEPAAGDSE